MSRIQNQRHCLPDQTRCEPPAAPRFCNAYIDLAVAIGPAIEADLANGSALLVFGDEYMALVLLQLFSEPGNMTCPRNVCG